jgi:hypothetical protein
MPVLAAALLSIDCDPAGCSADNCSGCCTPHGVCETGDSMYACGSGASICQVCSAGRVCDGSECTFPGVGGGMAQSGGGTGQTGGGGGTMGGPTGGGGGTRPDAGPPPWDGGMKSCLALPAFFGAQTFGGYDDQMGSSFEWAIMVVPSMTPGLFDQLQIFEAFPDTVMPPGPPYATMVVPGGESKCGTCAILSVGCQQGMTPSCQEDFLAQGGVIAITQHTLNPDAGTFSGMLTNLTFQQWHLATAADPMDMPVPNGDCAGLPNMPFIAHWP